MTAYPTQSELSNTAPQQKVLWRGGEVVWRVWGKGIPVILIHGGFGSWTHWIRTIPALADDHCVVVPDMPGFGDSDDVAMDDPVNDIVEALLAGIETIADTGCGIDVVGFSFGTVIAGNLAALIARTRPGKLRSLTLVAPAGLGISSKNFESLLSSSRGMTEQELREIHRHNLGVVMIADPAKITDETIYLQIANTSKKRRSGKPHSRSNLLRGFCRNLPLDHINVILGEKDNYVQLNEPEYSQALMTLYPDTRVHWIKGAGHWAQYECPASFNKLIRECLSEENR